MSWGLASVFFALYATLSIRLHQRMLTTGYDLGIFEQAVRSYAHGRLPVAELKGNGFPLLGKASAQSGAVRFTLICRASRCSESGWVHGLDQRQ
ncbi:DUF2079 domain-containing protein [Streptomyces sp. SAS_272]|uniref:DUF2079 domain-containing protein n=1 Tax=Streptomyces sp. SAS_272 TaxID=3412747 RepID=UPI00403C1A19